MALGTRTRHHLDQLEVPQLALARVQRSMHWVNSACKTLGFVRVASAPQLERLSTEELVKCFEAFIRRNALLGDFVPKMEGEFASRASSLMPAEAR